MDRLCSVGKSFDYRYGVHGIFILEYDLVASPIPFVSHPQATLPRSSSGIAIRSIDEGEYSLYIILEDCSTM